MNPSTAKNPPKHAPTIHAREPQRTNRRSRRSSRRTRPNAIRRIPKTRTLGSRFKAILSDMIFSRLSLRTRLAFGHHNKQEDVGEDSESRRPERKEDKSDPHQRRID